MGALTTRSRGNAPARIELIAQLDTHQTDLITDLLVSHNSC